MDITRYTVQDRRLSPFVKFFWELHTSDETISHKLLPTDNVDIILNLGDEIVYTVGSEVITAPKVHINGPRSGHSFIHQSGNIHVIGISCYSYGLYPFIRHSMADIKDRVVDLYSISSILAQELDLALLNENYIRNIERLLMMALPQDESFSDRFSLLKTFINHDESSKIQDFCNHHNISIKTFERHCITYTGYTPTMLRRIHRFQAVSNQIVHQHPGNLTDVAYSNAYADQAHLIRDFKSFTGEAPRSFTRQRISVKENAIYTYI